MSLYDILSGYLNLLSLSEVTHVLQCSYKSNFFAEKVAKSIDFPQMCVKISGEMIFCRSNPHGGGTEKHMEMTADQALKASIAVGNGMLRYGAEVHRVEDTITRICLAYGAAQVHAFAIGSNITVTVSDENGNSLTETRRILGSSYNLDRIDLLNDLSRYICSNKPSYEEISRRLAEIEKTRVYPWYVTIMGYAVIAFSFAVFFGGGLTEGVAALFIGALIRCVDLLLVKIGAGKFFRIVLCSALTAYTAYVSGAFITGFDETKAIIGVLMTLVPGISLTNSMRDFLAGDYLAGLLTLTESFLTAAAIAIGVAVAMTIFRI